MKYFSDTRCVKVRKINNPEDGRQIDELTKNLSIWTQFFKFISFVVKNMACVTKHGPQAITKELLIFS